MQVFYFYFFKFNISFINGRVRFHLSYYACRICHVTHHLSMLLMPFLDARAELDAWVAFTSNRKRSVGLKHEPDLTDVA